jgi:hypothetical protein
MNTPTEQTPVDLEGLIEASFYRVLDNEEIREGDLSPAVLACGPCLYPVSGYGGIAEKHEDFLRPFDINPILSEITTARQRVAELEQELTVSTSLAGKLAAKVEELDVLLSDQKHYTQQFIAQVRKEQRATQEAQATITSQSAEIERLRKALEQWLAKYKPVAVAYEKESPMLRPREAAEIDHLVTSTEAALTQPPQGRTVRLNERGHIIHEPAPPPRGEEVRKKPIKLEFPDFTTIYVASKTKHGAMWRSLRDKGYPIISTWIDESEAGQSNNLPDLALRCIREAASASFTILYCEPGETLKGALMETGAALAFCHEVRCVGTCNNLSPVLALHPQWRTFSTIDEALAAPSTSEAEGGGK